jgi:hypothetical protein
LLFPLWESYICRISHHASQDETPSRSVLHHQTTTCRSRTHLNFRNSSDANVLINSRRCRSACDSKCQGNQLNTQERTDETIHCHVRFDWFILWENHDLLQTVDASTALSPSALSILRLPIARGLFAQERLPFATFCPIMTISTSERWSLQTPAFPSASHPVSLIPLSFFSAEEPSSESAVYR